METVPVERVRLLDMQPSAVAKQFTCEHGPWERQFHYREQKVMQACSKCGLISGAEVDADARPIMGTGFTIYADQGTGDL